LPGGLGVVILHENAVCRAELVLILLEVLPNGLGLGSVAGDPVGKDQPDLRVPELRIELGGALEVLDHAGPVHPMSIAPVMYS